MNNIQIAKKRRLIKEANTLLDRIERNLRFIVESSKAKRNKKAA